MQKIRKQKNTALIAIIVIVLLAGMIIVLQKPATEGKADTAPVKECNAKEIGELQRQIKEIEKKLAEPSKLKASISELEQNMSFLKAEIDRLESNNLAGSNNDEIEVLLTELRRTAVQLDLEQKKLAEFEKQNPSSYLSYLKAKDELKKLLEDCQDTCPNKDCPEKRIGELQKQIKEIDKKLGRLSYLQKLKQSQEDLYLRIRQIYEGYLQNSLIIEKGLSSDVLNQNKVIDQVRAMTNDELRIEFDKFNAFLNEIDKQSSEPLSEIVPGIFVDPNSLDPTIQLRRNTVELMTPVYNDISEIEKEIESTKEERAQLEKELPDLLRKRNELEKEQSKAIKECEAK